MTSHAEVPSIHDLSTKRIVNNEPKDGLTHNQKREIALGQFYDNLEVTVSPHFEGKWNERVLNIPAGDHYFNELKTFVNLPIIVDDFDNHEIRSSFRVSAEEQDTLGRGFKGFNEVFMRNKLKLNNIFIIRGSIEALVYVEESRPDPELTSSDILDLKKIAERIDMILAPMPHKYDKLTLAEVTKDFLGQMLKTQSEPLAKVLDPLGIELSQDDMDSILVQQQIRLDALNSEEKLTPQSKKTNLDKVTLQAIVVESILSFLKKQNPELDRTHLRSRFQTIFTFNSADTPIYKSPKATTQQKVDFVNSIDKSLRAFLSQFESQ